MNAREAHGDVSGFGYDKFLHFHSHAHGGIFGQNLCRNIGGELLNELPTATLAESQQRLRDGVIINRLDQIIARGSGGEVVRHFNGQQETLRLGALGGGHADAVVYFEIGDGDGVHESYFLATVSSRTRVG